MKHFWPPLKKPILALAPMAGYTDAAFRLLCLENGADVVYTEMISVEALWRQNQKTLEMLHFFPKEKDVIIQLFGAEPESFKKAILALNNYFNNDMGSLGLARDTFKGIDINLGCPAHKVTKTGAGAALMNNKKTARAIMETVLTNTKLPVSIKIRSQVKNTTAAEFIDFVKDLPFDCVMVHGRSLSQGLAGEINYQATKHVKEILPDKIVLANGGVHTPADAQHLLEATGADGLGIGRGALGQPWIFKEIKKIFCLPPHLLSSPYKGEEDIGSPLLTKERARVRLIKKLLLRHAKLFLLQNKNLIPLRKHLVWYFKNQPDGGKIKQELIKVVKYQDLEKIMTAM